MNIGRLVFKGHEQYVTHGCNYWSGGHNAKYKKEMQMLIGYFCHAHMLWLSPSPPPPFMAFTPYKIHFHFPMRKSLNCFHLLHVTQRLHQTNKNKSIIT